MKTEQERWVDAHTLSVSGMGWTEATQPYTRLPNRAMTRVPESVWSLSRHAAGVYVSFQTRATVLSVRWSLISSALSMPHMPATGVSGLDLYHQNERRGWTFLTNLRPAGVQNESRIALPPSAARTGAFRLYLPLYNGVSSVQLMANNGQSIEALEESERPRTSIVVYGTSIAQGGCASRPGNAWPSMTGRDLNRPIVNLGFSGSGRMEPEVVDLIAELDPACFVLDCVPNMGDLQQEMFCTRIKNAAALLISRHPNTPLLFVGQDTQNTSTHISVVNKWQQDTVASLPETRRSKVAFVRGVELLGADNEGTVDGVHPNDLGMRRQADAITSALRRLVTKAR